MGTDFLGLRHAELAFGERLPAPEDLLIAALWYAAAEPGAGSLWSNTSGWRLGAAAVTHWRFGDTEVRIEAKSRRLRYRGSVAEREYDLRLVRRAGSRLEVEIDGRIEQATIVVCEGRLELFRAGGHVSLRRGPHRGCTAGQRRSGLRLAGDAASRDRGRGACGRRRVRERAERR